MQGAPTPEGVPLPEIMIMPSRLLSANTTEKILNRIYEVRYVKHINCQGESLPEKLTSGPGSGLPVNHPERKVIKVRGKDTGLKILVGRIFVEIDDLDGGAGNRAVARPAGHPGHRARHQQAAAGGAGRAHVRDPAPAGARAGRRGRG